MSTVQSKAKNGTSSEERSYRATIFQGRLAVFTTILTGLAFALTVAGLVWGYHQWRQEQTLEFRKEWLSAEMLASRQAVVDAMICQMPRADPNAALKDKPNAPWKSRQLRQANWRNTLAAGDVKSGYKGLDHEIGAMLDFYSGLNGCMKTVCDQRLACSLFDEDAETYDNLFRRYLNEQRGLMFPEFGREFATFHRNCEQLQTPEKGSQAPITEDPNETKRNLGWFNYMMQQAMSDSGPTHDRIDQSCSRMGVADPQQYREIQAEMLAREVRLSE